MTTTTIASPPNINQFITFTSGQNSWKECFLLTASNFSMSLLTLVRYLSSPLHRSYSFFFTNNFPVGKSGMEWSILTLFTWPFEQHFTIFVSSLLFLLIYAKVLTLNYLAWNHWLLITSVISSLNTYTNKNQDNINNNDNKNNDQYNFICQLQS